MAACKALVTLSGVHSGEFRRAGFARQSGLHPVAAA